MNGVSVNSKRLPSKQTWMDMFGGGGGWHTGPAADFLLRSQRPISNPRNHGLKVALLLQTGCTESTEETFARRARHPNQCSGNLSQCFTPVIPSLV